MHRYRFFVSFALLLILLLTAGCQGEPADPPTQDPVILTAIASAPNPFPESADTAPAGTADRTNHLIYVDGQTGNKHNPGSQSAPLKSIQKAASQAPPGDTVLVLAGEYPERINGNRLYAPLLTSFRLDMRPAIRGTARIKASSP
ncbi:MAG: DUF1565 domain-containing protein [Anaerolineales bacterium]|nr:DUF1565 domain-containing protein [Anaerolineales bacterium]